MKHNNDTYYTIPEFNTAIDNELKRWLEILASYNDDRKLKKSFKKDFQNAYDILEPFASSYYLDSSVKADEKYNHVLWDMKINQLKNFLLGYSYEELQCMCKYCMNYFLKERIEKIVYSHGEPNHYKYCISSICINTYSTTPSTTYSTHKPPNGKKESE